MQPLAHRTVNHEVQGSIPAQLLQAGTAYYKMLNNNETL